MQNKNKLSAFIFVSVIVFSLFAFTPTVIAVDSTFGYNVIGGSSETKGTEKLVGCKYTLTEDGTAINIKCYCAAFSGTINAKCAIYSDNSGLPNALIVESNQVAVSSANWYEFTVSQALSAGDYWLSFIADNLFTVYYDAGASGQTQINFNGVSYPTFPDPFNPTDWAAESNKISIYVTYTTSGGESFSYVILESANASCAVYMSKSLVSNQADSTVTVSSSNGLSKSVFYSSSLGSQVLSLNGVFKDITSVSGLLVSDSIGAGLTKNIFYRVVETASLVGAVSFLKSVVSNNFVLSAIAGAASTVGLVKDILYSPIQDAISVLSSLVMSKNVLSFEFVLSEMLGLRDFHYIGGIGGYPLIENDLWVVGVVFALIAVALAVSMPVVYSRRKKSDD